MNLIRKIKYASINKVNLFIIGEQKCGTSSLHSLILKSKVVLQGYRKECHYFNSYSFIKDNNYEDYHQIFMKRRGKHYKYIIDSTPAYFCDNNICDKIFEYNNESKLILIVRNPLDRIISAYNFYYSNVLVDIENYNNAYFKNSYQGNLIYSFLKQNPNLSLEDVLEQELKGNNPLRLIERSLYGKHLLYWQSIFPKNQIQVLIFENLIDPKKRDIEIEALSNFLNIELDKSFPLRNKTIESKINKFSFNTTILKLINDDITLLNKLIDKTDLYSPKL